jgi:hypothetical protein
MNTPPPHPLHPKYQGKKGNLVPKTSARWTAKDDKIGSLIGIFSPGKFPI